MVCPFSNERIDLRYNRWGVDDVTLCRRDKERRFNPKYDSTLPFDTFDFVVNRYRYYYRIYSTFDIDLQYRESHGEVLGRSSLVG
jgi:hypothetical protein